MKKNLIKIAAITTVFAFGLGLVINTQKQPVRVDAAQHSANYDSYTYSGTYYDSLDFTAAGGMNGTFRKAVTSLVYPKGFYIYGGGGSDHLSGVLQYADEDPSNSSNMVMFYTRDSIKKTAATVDGTMIWNREHVWPQSLSKNNAGTQCWGTDEAGTDILHLRPTYETCNSYRGNTPYGDCNKTPTATYNSMTYGYGTKGGDYFEPLDSVKGDVARILMYVWTTYTDHYNGLKLTNVISYETLIKWHTLDKPDALEGVRNDYCQTSKQKNRNPFVDHPEYAWKIFGDNVSTATKNACVAAYPAEGGSVTPDKTLTNISISGAATKKAYYVGDTFDPLGLIVTATYDDSTTATIANSDCTWSPNPLTLATTSVTCTYGGKTATYSGITVSQKTTPAADSYSVVFKQNSADGSGEIEAANILSEATTNTLVKSVSESTKVYSGINGLKLGSSKATGSITFTLNEDARSNIASIKIESAKYSSDAGNLVLKFDSTTIASDIVPGQTFTKALTDFSATTITISTSSKRAYLTSVTLIPQSQEHQHTFETDYDYNETTHWHNATCGHEVISGEEPHIFVDTIVPATREAGGYTTHTCSVCGYSYRDSETPQITLVNITATDNKADTGYEIGEELDLSVKAHYSDDSYEDLTDYTVEGFNSQVAGEQNIIVKCGEKEITLVIAVLPAGSGEIPIDSSSSASISSEQPIEQSSAASEQPETSTPELPAPEEKTTRGCSGSVVATASLAAFSGLIGLVFIFFKKKQ